MDQIETLTLTEVIAAQPSGDGYYGLIKVGAERAGEIALAVPCDDLLKLAELALMLAPQRMPGAGQSAGVDAYRVTHWTVGGSDDALVLGFVFGSGARIQLRLDRSDERKMRSLLRA